MQDEPALLLTELPDVVLRCIIFNLPIQDRFNLAEADEHFHDLLSDKCFWKVLWMDSDDAFVNRVCTYVLEHCSAVSEVVIDNVGSPDNTFVASWTDVLLGAFRNVRKVNVVHSTFLTSGLFVSTAPLLSELKLRSCPNMSAFTLLQGFLCGCPKKLMTLDLTGVPGLSEPSAVQIATSCEALESLDMSGFWGPLLCVLCTKKIISGCPQLKWFDLCPYRPHILQWQDLLAEYKDAKKRKVCFSPYVTHVLGDGDD